MQFTTLGKIVGGLLAVIILILIVVGVVNLAKNATNGSNDGPGEPAELTLSDYRTADSQVAIEHDNPIVGREEHYVVKISVNSTQRTLEVFQGYEEVAKIRKQFKNDQNAYDEFLDAISYEGFLEKQDSDIGENESGVCPSGRRIVGTLSNFGEEISRLWSASCSRKLGTMAGDSRAILELFEDQIPNFDKLVDDVDF